jgi:GNAT superfamily N-acetyltransferase
MDNIKNIKKSKEGLDIVQYDGYLGISYRTLGDIPAVSQCQLSATYPSIYQDIWDIPDSAMVYDFNRIKAGWGREGKGDGTKMMQKLVEMADDQGFYIVGGINAYGNMDYKALKKWYTKYGFEFAENENIMIRKPMK